MKICLCKSKHFWKCKMLKILKVSCSVSSICSSYLWLFSYPYSFPPPQPYTMYVLYIKIINKPHTTLSFNLDPDKWYKKWILSWRRYNSSISEILKIKVISSTIKSLIYFLYCSFSTYAEFNSQRFDLKLILVVFILILFFKCLIKLTNRLNCGL